MIVIMGVNLLFYLAPLAIIENVGMNPGQVNEWVDLFFTLHAKGILLWGIFFGIHLMILGILVRQSPHHPSWLGLLMQIGSVGYVLEAINDFCFAADETIGMLAMGLLMIVIVGELGFAIWLIMKGRK